MLGDQDPSLDGDLRAARVNDEVDAFLYSNLISEKFNEIPVKISVQ